MHIKTMIDKLKAGEEKYLDILVDYYYPIFLEKAKNNKPDYYMPDRVKKDVTDMILRYVNNGLKTKFTDYIKSMFVSYCNVSKKKVVSKGLDILEPLDEVEMDEYYIDKIYSKLINPCTTILTKEEKQELSYMLYFKAKDSYYKTDKKSTFSTYIGNYINHFFVNRKDFSKRDKVFTMYIYLIGINGSLKDYCNKKYINMCNKYNYEYKEEEFIECINGIHVNENKNHPISLDKKIENFILKKTKEKINNARNKSIEDNNNDYIKLRLYEEFKDSGIDNKLLSDYIDFYYSTIVKEYENKNGELKSTLQKCINTKLRKGIQTLIIKDKESKKIIEDVINNGKFPESKNSLLEESRIKVLRTFYVSDIKNPGPKMFRNTIFEQALYVVFSDADEELEKELI